MEGGARRWLVDVSRWAPQPDRFDSLVSLLPAHERPAVTRFIKFEDKKRALVSRLLQYSLVHEVLGIPFQNIIINRTIEGKPYLENNGENLISPNFNFNASHHGDYVGIASEPMCLVGLDIVSMVIPFQEPAMEFIKNFQSYFTNLEWKYIIYAGSSNEILTEFCRYWCLKEAYVKALGAGLGYGLHRLEFHHTNWNNISVRIDGKKSRNWRFQLFQLDNGHWAAVARGHPKVATENYRGSDASVVFEENDYWNGIQTADTGFIFRTVEQLVPVPHPVSPASIL